ncbi:unnamed protein product [Rotaria sp. Silwood2]|nr:unnamed protein product [Rotaria sp. Silwood2]CAF4186848.1 unnamed protein product [Rotaria sp. Silwood2]
MNQVNVYLLPIFFIALTSFIIGSLLYDHFQRGYLFTSRSSNETIFIEQALKRIQRCNEGDHSRQRALLNTFQTWNHLAQSHYLRYWIAYKTLSGYIQHNDLPPYDDDIDIFIMYQDIPQLINLSNGNYSSIYELEIHPQWFITKPFNRSYSPSEIIDFAVKNSRFINHENNVAINIWPIYKYYNKHILLYVEYFNFDNLIISPIEWTFPLEPCVFSGIRVWCPAQPKKLTTSIYKQASMYISCINGSWIRSNQ